MRDIDPMIGIRKFRQDFAAEHNYDIRAMSAALRRISEEHGHLTVPPPVESARETLASPRPAAEFTVVENVRIG